MWEQHQISFSWFPKSMWTLTLYLIIKFNSDTLVVSVRFHRLQSHKTDLTLDLSHKCWGDLAPESRLQSCCLVTNSYLTLCDPMDCSMPGFLVLHHLQEFAQTRIHWVGDAIQPFHPLSSLSPPAFNLWAHFCLFSWVSAKFELWDPNDITYISGIWQWLRR